MVTISFHIPHPLFHLFPWDFTWVTPTCLGGPCTFHGLCGRDESPGGWGGLGRVQDFLFLWSDPEYSTMRKARGLMSNSLNLNPGLSANLGHISKLHFSVVKKGIMIISIFVCWMQGIFILIKHIPLLCWARHPWDSSMVSQIATFHFFMVK